MQDPLLRDVVRNTDHCSFTLKNKLFRSKPKLRLVIRRLVKFLDRERLNSKQNIECVHLVTDLVNRLVAVYNRYTSDVFRCYGVYICCY